MNSNTATLRTDWAYVNNCNTAWQTKDQKMLFNACMGFGLFWALAPVIIGLVMCAIAVILHDKSPAVFLHLLFNMPIIWAMGTALASSYMYFNFNYDEKGEPTDSKSEIVWKNLHKIAFMLICQYGMMIVAFASVDSFSPLSILL